MPHTLPVTRNCSLVVWASYCISAQLLYSSSFDCWTTWRKPYTRKLIH